jgi:hypothetical protein
MDSPYNVIGDITIPAGNDLLIQPGVLVNITGNFRINAVGTLTATGTEADTIRFVSTQADPTALWVGIRLENESQYSNIQYCYIEKATYGVNSVNSPVNISYNRFYKNQKGMQLYAIGASTPANVTVDYNLIEWSIQNGIFIVQNSNAVIADNEIRYNGTGTQYMAAIQLSNQSTGGSNSPLIQDNHIHHNFKQGITGWDIVGANAIQPQILNNVIENNLTGIYLLNASGYVADNIIRNNFIAGDANSGAGVMVAGATSAPYFERNEIYGNFTGFYLGTNAQPCLGDLASNHAWAQGENQIYDNIDESNTLHSVYTYSYTNSAIVIKAENNNWGTNDPAEIAVGINDHNDSASLPTVDFEPFLTGEIETVVNGSVEYNGILDLSNYRIQFVDADGGDIYYEYPVDATQPFTFTLVLPAPFHVVVLADLTGVGVTHYGTPGGLLLPGTFSPGDFAPVDVGVIEIEEALPPRYQEAGAPVMIGTHNCYPVYNRFFVYHWEYINWLYEEGDYLFIKRHERYNDVANIIFNLPDNTVWDKVRGIGYNDAWTRTEFLDDSGTQRQSVLRCKFISEGINYDEDRLIIQRDLTDQSLISMRLITADTRQLYHYDGSYLKRAENINHTESIPYLQEGSSWEYTAILPIYQPVNLCYDYMEHLNSPEHLTLYWQAPMDDGVLDWTTYRIYKGSQLHAEVPFTQNYWQTETWDPFQNYELSVRAYDGNQESPCTNVIYIPEVGNYDQVAVPTVIAIQPNPASLSQDNGIGIRLSGGDEQEGSIGIYNLRGQLVRTVPIAAKGSFDWRWDLRDQQGSLCSSGIYLLKAELRGEQPFQRRLAILK